MKMITTEQRTCEQHGTYEATNFLADRWTGCSACAKAAEEDRRRQREEREQRERIAAMLRQSGLAGRFLDTTLDNFVADTASKRKVLHACRQYAEGFGPASGNLWLTGPCGTGKTHAAAGLVRYVIEQHHKWACITTPRAVIRRLRATWRPGSVESETDVINDLAANALLVLDEAGVSFGTDAELIQLYDVVNERYVHQRPTVVVSNLSPALLKDALGDRLFDRLRENARVITFDWASARAGT